VPYKQIVMCEGAKAAPSAFDHLIGSTPVEVKGAA
jgi:alkyl hydroperoxide reductase subunit AhpF